MSSVLDNIGRLAKNLNGNSYSKIAIEILKQIHKNGKILRQDELAAISFVSQSTITKFSQKLGYQGYRELCFEIKHEMLTYQLKTHNDSNNNKFNPIIAWIIANNKFINKIVNAICTNVEIKIIYSLQFESPAKFLYDMLLSLNKAAYLINHTNNMSWHRNSMQKLDKKNVNIIFFSGRDDETLEFSMNNWANMHEFENFVVLTEQQKSKVSIPANFLTLNFYSENPSYVQINVALQMLIFDVFERIVDQNKNKI